MRPDTHLKVAEFVNSGALMLNTMIFAMNPGDSFIQLSCMGIQVVCLGSLRLGRAKISRVQALYELPCTRPDSCNHVFSGAKIPPVCSVKDELDEKVATR